MKPLKQNAVLGLMLQLGLMHQGASGSTPNLGHSVGVIMERLVCGQALVQSLEPFQVHAEFYHRTDAELVPRLSNEKPSLLVIDLATALSDLVVLREQIESIGHYRPKIVALGACSDPSDLAKVIELKVASCVYESALKSPQALADAIQSSAAGNDIVQLNTLSEMANLCRLGRSTVATLGSEGAERGTAALTARERQILLFVADGKKNEAIAFELNVAVSTVKNHLANIRQKLGLVGRGDRREMAAFAAQLGILH